MKFNGLTDAEEERLYMLWEELSEAGQAIGKILRHGYASQHPGKLNTTHSNRRDLENEVGDVLGVLAFMGELGDLNKDNVSRYAFDKITRASKYMHHQDMKKVEEYIAMEKRLR